MEVSADSKEKGKRGVVGRCPSEIKKKNTIHIYSTSPKGSLIIETVELVKYDVHQGDTWDGGVGSGRIEE